MRTKKSENTTTEQGAQTAQTTQTAGRPGRPPKKAAPKITSVIQYQGKDLSQDEIFKAAKKDWAKQYKKKQADLKSIELYIKPEEMAVYYVANKKDAGHIEL